MSETAEVARACPACSRLGTGAFCAYCGAAMGVISCAACSAELGAGARFCHKCGNPVGRRARQPLALGSGGTGIRQWVPWSIGLVTLMIVAYIAGATFRERTASPAQSLSESSSGFPLANTPQSPARGPDISQMSPEEQADRLFNRVMLLSTQGKTDSVLFFAPMAINAYQLLAPLSADQRYDVGRIAEVAGVPELARAQADTILAANPTHLLGLVLGARAAALKGDSATRRSFLKRLAAANAAELAKKLPEYERHGTDITEALADARREAAAGES